MRVTAGWSARFFTHEDMITYAAGRGLQVAIALNRTGTNISRDKANYSVEGRLPSLLWWVLFPPAPN